MDIKKALEKAIEFEAHSRECYSVEFLEDDPEFFKYVVRVLKKLESIFHMEE